MWGDDESERLYLAPRNTVSEPHGQHRGYNGQERLVVVRLVWSWGVEFRPARLLWVDDDAVRVAWERHGVERRSWVRKADVRTAMRW